MPAKPIFFGCKIKNCEAEYSSKGFCKTHYFWLRKGWCLEDGTITEKCRAKIKYDECRYPGCLRWEVHARGLCVKHYKMLRKGNIDENLKIIKPQKVTRYRYGAKCIVVDCESSPRRYGMCPKHSSAYRDGKITKAGLPSDTFELQKRKYNKDYQCLSCSAKGRPKYVLGFCKRCYGRYRKGIIDFYGKPKRALRRRTYTADATCKVAGCDKRPRGRGFCDNHLHALLHTKTINTNGSRAVPASIKNKGRSCVISSCDQPAICKGYCKTHYSRLQSTGIAYADRKDNPNWKNIGKICSVDGCNQPAAVRAMCTTHYSRFMTHGDPEKTIRRATLAGVKCIECDQPAFAKERCRSHYQRYSYGLKRLKKKTNDAKTQQEPSISSQHPSAYPSQNPALATVLCSES